MAMCAICKRKSRHISSTLSVCLQCIRNSPERALELTAKAHERSRARFSLTPAPPRAGIRCPFCGNACEIPNNAFGFCGLVKNLNGRLVRDNELIAEWYYDALPTNCVAAPFCAANGIGYPRYACTQTLETGYKNLSIFCIGCAFDCLFCQNWHFRQQVANKEDYKQSDERLLKLLDERTSCICWFGGDPAPQLDKIVRFCRLANQRVEQKEAGAIGDKGQRTLRYCIETCGNASRSLMRAFAPLALDSGGTIKFDLKFFDENLSKAISGVSNKRSYELFEELGKLHSQRRKPPLLAASTLLLPGYIDDQEIRAIANFIASIDPTIPYSLLAFFPHFEMTDLPLTRRRDALRWLELAKGAGLENVRIGNVHLLV